MAQIPLRRLWHWGPLTVLCIIKLITWAVVHFHSMWWPPSESMGAALHAILFLGLAAGTLYYFLQALFEGPGFVPPGWKPENEEDTKNLQFCSVCNGWKPPRSHHCRSCGYCVLKMDHHCPWINCCVGHSNHGYFNMFLISAVLGCFQASIVLIISVYHAIYRVWYTYHGTGQEPIVYVTFTTLPPALIAIGMALGVVLAVGVLLYVQIKGILRNQTTIEEWIVEKADSRRRERGLPPFVFPYNVGVRENVRMLLSPGDGMKWPVREGCGEYDLTREQMAQKAEKRLRARTCRCVAPYSGRWCPARAQPRAALCPPCAAEPRLPLRAGDRVAVTRHRQRWMYGEKIGEGEGRGPRGWFPRACVTEDRLKPD